MNKPNLFIVGAAKSGTTSLYRYLSQHPNIFMCPIKEPNFFCKDIRQKDFTRKTYFDSIFNINTYLSRPNLDIIHNAFIKEFSDYIQLYRDVKNEQVIGETSVSYLYSTQAAKEICKYNPESKIVIILRNPIERTFSHWKMNLSTGIEKKNVPFYEAVINDIKNTNKGWGRSHLYIELGLYYEQVKRYINIFPKNNILILLYEDLYKNSKNISQNLFSFINVTPVYIDLDKRFNESKMQRFPKLIRLVRKYNFKKYIPPLFRDHFKNLLTSRKVRKLDNNTRSRLFEYFNEDIIKLEDLIKLDLTKWKID